uniref:Structural maintenance of chromosomes protein 2 n=1 Tax=Amazona collaria TaxID=241587 RepID=A0A8B9J099_9PSIT
MYIKSIVLDGFKSYAQRTEIQEFDPFFNAITGLNGSGKSNILDSICFLLGITSMSQVRASNLQDLVYKNGQAGVTKATVSITFDNSDKKASPLGFESSDEISVTRQVVIGGRNKYLINGVNVTSTRVQDLFCSIGLNINNPHFLIMQGQITKVLNMKPPEILAMIEEAAGTRLYESKKLTVQKTIAKKEAKLKEINRVLDETITPTLRKLREERSAYLEYQRLTGTVENLSRLSIAYEFTVAEEAQVSSAEVLKKMQTAVKELQESVAENEKKQTEIEEEITKMKKERDNEVSGVLHSLEEAFAEIQRVNTKAESALNLKKQNLKSEEAKRKELVKNMEEDFKALLLKKEKVKKIQNELNALQEASEKDASALAAAQLNAVSSGSSTSGDGEEGTLSKQMMTCKIEISQAATEAEQVQMKLRYAQQELETKESEVKNMDGEYKKDKETFEAVRKTKEEIENQMKNLNYDEKKEAAFLAKKKALTNDIRRLKELCEGFTAKFPYLWFEYKHPEKNWNPNNVKGLVAFSITVKDPSKAKSLEAVAGGKLYNIIVDTEVTGQKVLKNGELKHRYTIIPLNKILARCVSKEKIKLAQTLVGSDNLHLPLSLIQYESELKKAMEYVFGTTLVCDSMESSKKITFDKRIMTRSVTLDGDIFDPQGTLHGGASSQAASVLAELPEIKAIKTELETKKSELRSVEDELERLKNVAVKYQQLKQQWEMNCEQAELLEMKLQQSAYHKHEEELLALKKTIVECEETLKKIEEKHQEAKNKYSLLENKMKNAESECKKALKIAKMQLEDAKKKAEDSGQKMREKQQRSKEELGKKKELIMSQHKEIKAKSAEIVKCREQNNVLQLNIKELEHNIKKHQQRAADAAATVTRMLKENKWIASEKHLFGQPNTAYDFKKNNPKEAHQKLQKMQEAKEKLWRNMNMRAMSVLSDTEEKYNELLKKKRIVENDKIKILSAIEELDRRKIKTLHQAWEKVNKDFSSIFSLLLPGAKAMLTPTKTQNILDGLEFRVALGNTWKENLTELSGGQRSLVALSLILAMLLFNPAPIYILDEVDAALDLSHTQNIGQMLYTHFRQSQFIVVSLKDGMFSNANVLFKTKFVDGVSTISRHISRSGEVDSTSADMQNKRTPLVF